MRSEASASLSSSTDDCIVGKRQGPLPMRFRALAALMVVVVTGCIVVVFAAPESPRQLARMIEGTACATGCFRAPADTASDDQRRPRPVTSPPSAWWSSSTTDMPLRALRQSGLKDAARAFTTALDASTPAPEESARPRRAPAATTAALLPDAEVKAALADVMLVLSMSPARYHLAPLVRQHYGAFFTHMVFIGPEGDRNTSVEIHEHDTFYGNGQYRAMASVMRTVEGTAAAAGLAGYLYLADDLLLQPWTLVGLNKTVPWASMLGVGNVGGKRMLRTTPSAGMAVERETRKSHWAQWRKNRPRLVAVLDSPFGVERLQPKLARAFQRTPRYVRRTTGWRRERRATEAELKYFVFFTIADAYYVPRSIAMAFAEVCDAMAAQIVHGELAIPTALQALSETYEVLSVQYYWASPSAGTDCPRYRWNPDAVGIHRCVHDHPFAEAIYNASSRRRLVADEEYRMSMLRMPYRL